MASPSPPIDKDTRTIIDKLANFVARNGPEFEKMTMSKKRDDPKFGFLFGGEHNPYYRWKVEMERSAQQSSIISAQPLSAIIPSNNLVDNDSLLIESLEQLKEKEQMDIVTHGIYDPLEIELNNVLQPVMESCSKEAIASGKSWIFSHSRSPDESGRMAHYMLRSVSRPGINFNHKLHLVYLINDILHHCIRKNADDLKQAIETVIIQIFYNIYSTEPNNVDDLKKVLAIWESQNCLNKTKLEQIQKLLNYPSSKLPNCQVKTTKQQWNQTTPIGQPAPPIGQPAPPTGCPGYPASAMPTVPTSYSVQTPPAPPTGPPVPPTGPPAPPTGPPAPPTGPPVPPTGPPAPPTGPPAPPTGPPAPRTGGPPGTVPPWIQSNQFNNVPTPLFDPSETLLPTSDSSLTNTQIIDYNHQPSTTFQQSLQVFDYQHQPAHWDIGTLPHPPIPPDPYNHPPQFFSHPPPDIPFSLPPPSLPYFDLPAGLIIQLVPLSEHMYTPLNPHLVCLPAPQPPSERLLEAVEEFYYPPSDDKPRNDEGWEAKALLDFYEAKTKAKNNQRQEKYRSTRRQRSRSRTPKRRRRRSSSRSLSKSPRRRKRSSRSPSSSWSSSSDGGYSPQRRRYNRSRSQSPLTQSISDDVSKTKKFKSDHEILTEDNVGHQLLKRMGWETGEGLGARSQGIQEPIKEGEARDKTNQFAGVGINMKDPFEQFRKNKSYTFNRRAPPPPPADQ